MKWQVEDPAGHSHVVEYDHHGIWHGTDNLTHTEDNKSQRGYTIRRLCNFMLEEPEAGDWAGWLWLKL